MNRRSAIDCLAIPVALAADYYPKEEAILFGLVYGMSIGKNHKELADALTEVGVDILLSVEGTTPTQARRDLFDRYMQDIIEIMSVTLT